MWLEDVSKETVYTVCGVFGMLFLSMKFLIRPGHGCSACYDNTTNADFNY